MWRPIDTAPRDGARVLVDFGRIGVHAVSCRDPEDHGVWHVDDRKHGPFPLRGYRDEDILGWQPLPPSQYQPHLQRPAPEPGLEEPEDPGDAGAVDQGV